MMALAAARAGCCAPSTSSPPLPPRWCSRLVIAPRRRPGRPLAQPPLALAAELSTALALTSSAAGPALASSSAWGGTAAGAASGLPPELVLADLSEILYQLSQKADALVRPPERADT